MNFGNMAAKPRTGGDGDHGGGGATRNVSRKKKTRKIMGKTPRTNALR